jgi:hypothetical protein
MPRILHTQAPLRAIRTRTIGSNQQICAFSVTARKPRDDLFAIDYMTRKGIA